MGRVNSNSITICYRQICIRVLADPASAYGVAGSLVIMLLWVSYSCLLIFFGAEFTLIFARRYGQKIRPAKHAFRVKIELVKDNEDVAQEEANKPVEKR